MAHRWGLLAAHASATVRVFGLPGRHLLLGEHRLPGARAEVDDVDLFVRGQQASTNGLDGVHLLVRPRKPESGALRPDEERHSRHVLRRSSHVVYLDSRMAVRAISSTRSSQGSSRNSSARRSPASIKVSRNVWSA